MKTQKTEAKPFINAFDFDETDIRAEINLDPSETVPDMSMGLRELLDRYTRGGSVATLTPNYQDGDDFDESPDISRMDATEKLQYARDIKDAIAEHQNKPKPEPKPEPEPKPKPESEEPEPKP